MLNTCGANIVTWKGTHIFATKLCWLIGAVYYLVGGFLSCDWLFYTYYTCYINLNTSGITYHLLGYWDEINKDLLQ